MPFLFICWENEMLTLFAYIDMKLIIFIIIILHLSNFTPRCQNISCLRILCARPTTWFGPSEIPLKVWTWMFPTYTSPCTQHPNTISGFLYGLADVQPKPILASTKENTIPLGLGLKTYTFLGSLLLDCEFLQ